MSNILVSPSWLQAHICDENMVILDATQKEKRIKVATKHQNLQIEGSRFFDIKNDFSDTDNPFPNAFPSKEKFEESCQKIGINRNSIIIVYDALGIFSSARVWWLFKTFGHEQVFILNGGFPNWIANRFPTETLKNNTFAKGNFVAKLNSKNVWFFSDIKENITTNHALVIDARSSNRFNNLVAEPRKGLRSGNIPNSVNLPYTEVLDNGLFKSNDELKKIFSNFDQSKPFVFICGSGITACILLVAYKLATDSQNIRNNLEVQNNKVYDGSWTEFGTLEK